MSKRDSGTVEDREREYYGRLAEEAEARANEPVTRRELVEAIDNVGSHYALSGTHDHDLISNAFERLAQVLR